jgi:hypothetical protein
VVLGLESSLSPLRRNPRMRQRNSASAAYSESLTLFRILIISRYDISAMGDLYQLLSLASYYLTYASNK